MNEQKLEELVEQAITQNESVWPDFRKALTGNGSLYLHVFAKEFAEVIVRECARRSYLEDSGNPEVEEALEFWRKDMLKHFGVEE